MLNIKILIKKGKFYKENTPETWKVQQIGLKGEVR